jgi:hypothetical protein
MPGRLKSSGILILAIPVVPLSMLGQPKPDILKFEPFIWKSAPPGDCPFALSPDLAGIRFLGVKSGFHFGDTWYPSWASDANLYSPRTDGGCWRLDGSVEGIYSGDGNGGLARTGRAIMVGNDPLTLKVYSLGTKVASAAPGRKLPMPPRNPC